MISVVPAYMYAAFTTKDPFICAILPTVLIIQLTDFQSMQLTGLFDCSM